MKKKKCAKMWIYLYNMEYIDIRVQNLHVKLNSNRISDLPEN